ncbi:MAG: aspartyl-tRNA(Asn)/glutamyl-tRNA(Gln) amidotransferase subunit A [Chloroflexi bacterium]|nr:MAG: aspartyl-tRNA(Asn)/glutamyl-tRNA(Gln) amidotransferase subunit A [Chloroflexota bacterium]
MSQTRDELCWMTISEAAPLIKRRELSPVELTQAHLDRADAVDDRVKAFVTRIDDKAMAAARAAESEIASGHYRGPLHGIPVSLKDFYDTAGVRTTAMSKIFADRVPDEDCTVAASLKGAGTVLLGKVSMSEFGLRGHPTSLFSIPNNPWNLNRSCGQSSSGSAASLAAGVSMGSFGSDSGGSLRNPAHSVGIVGLKPTFGRVSRYGVIPCSHSMDTTGPMARSVADIAALLQATAGHDPHDPYSSKEPVPDYSANLNDGIKGLRIGVPRDYFFNKDGGADPETLDLAEQAIDVLEGLGAQVKEVTIPSVADVRASQGVIMISEAFAYHRQFLRDRHDEYGPVKFRFMLGALYTAEDYLQAQLLRSRICREVAEVFEQVDIIATPSMPRPASVQGDMGHPFSSLGGLNFLVVFNATGHPAISVPCGFTGEGMPVGLQLAARPFQEAALLTAANAYQQSTDWHTKHPVL